MTRAPVPTLAGYTFSGWTTTSDITLEGDNFNMPDNDVVFTGHWIVNSQDLHEITFDTNGGRFYFPGSPSTHVVNVRHGNTLPSVSFFSRPHYTFIGWCSVGDGDSILTPTQLYEWIVEGPHTFTAMWEETWHDITFDLNGGYVDSDPSPLVFNVRCGHPHFGTAIVPHPTRPGYTFMGWWCGESDLLFSIMNIFGVWRPWTFTAVWELDDNAFSADTDLALSETMSYQDVCTYDSASNGIHEGEATNSYFVTAIGREWLTDDFDD